VDIAFTRLLGVSILAALLATACDGGRGPLAPPRTDPVELGAVTFTPNPRMVTAAVAHVGCSGPVAAVQVFYAGPAVAGLDYGSTPRIPASVCPVDVNVLGLLASTHYSTVTTVWGQGGEVRRVVGPDVVTDSLPASLPQITTQAFGVPPVGLTAFAVFTSSLAPPTCALIVDSIGRVRWYVVASNGFITDLQPQPNRHFTLSQRVAGASQAYDELDVAGNVLRSWTASGAYGTDNHELRLTSRGTGILLGFDVKTIDLTAFGGSPTAQVVGNVLEEVDSAGQTPFVWNAFDHFSITDIDPSISLATPTVDWNHGNAIEVDQDGNYLVSFRHESEITKIDSRTGNVIWRWGGVKNQFTFTGDTLMFSFQHGIRRLRNGHYILFDNGDTHNPPFSRAVEYVLDQNAKVATLVWSYRPSPDIFSPFIGFAQRLANANTLVTFGPQGTLHEVLPSGQLAWQLSLPPGNWIYRAYRIRSIYEPDLVDESLTP
jgi:arylsulfotransferase ASST